MRKAVINRLYYETAPKERIKFVMFETLEDGTIVEHPTGRIVTQEYVDSLPHFTLDMNIRGLDLHDNT